MCKRIRCFEVLDNLEPFISGDAWKTLVKLREGSLFIYLDLDAFTKSRKCANVLT
jgi:hypothetical protein